MSTVLPFILIFVDGYAYWPCSTVKWFQRVANFLCMPSTLARPFSHAFELNSTNRCLHFHHAPVGPKAVMNPAEANRMITLVDGFPALAVILERPHTRPEFLIVGGHHATFATGGHDLVLTE